jgi:hypothetical protein
MTRDDLLWLAGYLEGEGSFTSPTPSAPNRPRIQVAATDEDVIQRIAAIWGVSYWRSPETRNPAWKPYYRVQVRGRRAVDLMRELRPLMGIRRQQQIDRALEDWSPRANRIPRDKLNEMGRRHLAGESTRSLGREYGVSHETVRRAAQNRARITPR